MEFTHDMHFVGAILLVRDILNIPLELEVLKTGGEAGRVEVGHGRESTGGRDFFYKQDPG